MSHVLTRKHSLGKLLAIQLVALLLEVRHRYDHQPLENGMPYAVWGGGK